MVHPSRRNSELRTGSANLSPSGLKQQDNDLIILRDPAAVAKFEARFAEVYAAADPMRVESEGKRPVARTPLVASPPPDPTCSIKGNVNAKGERIYHKPGDQNYDRVNMAGCDHGNRRIHSGYRRRDAPSRLAGSSWGPVSWWYRNALDLDIWIIGYDARNNADRRKGFVRGGNSM